MSTSLPLEQADGAAAPPHPRAGLLRRGRAHAAAFWMRFWMRWAGTGPAGRLAAWLAGLATPPYAGRFRLAQLYPHGYTAPSAAIAHRGCRRGKHTFVGDRSVIYGHPGAGDVVLQDGAALVGDTRVEVGRGGGVTIGAGTYIQPNCHLASFVEPIIIGEAVQIATCCRFYSYDHAAAPDRPIHQQGLVSKGPILIEDDVWLGTGVVVLSGVRIGRGAVVGAGSVVTRDIPEGAIAVGSPAKVVKHRSDLA